MNTPPDDKWYLAFTVPNAPYRYVVVFVNGSVEPIAESSHEGQWTSFLCRDVIEFHPPTPEGHTAGTIGVFARLVPHGARSLIDASTDGEEIAVLAERLDALRASRGTAAP